MPRISTRSPKAPSVPQVHSRNSRHSSSPDQANRTNSEKMPRPTSRPGTAKKIDGERHGRDRHALPEQQEQLEPPPRAVLVELRVVERELDRDHAHERLRQREVVGQQRVDAAEAHQYRDRERQQHDQRLGEDPEPAGAQAHRGLSALRSPGTARARRGSRSRTRIRAAGSAGWSLNTIPRMRFSLRRDTARSIEARGERRARITSRKPSTRSCSATASATGSSGGQSTTT